MRKPSSVPLERKASHSRESGGLLLSNIFTGINTNIEAKLHLSSVTVGKPVYDFQILTNPFISEKTLKIFQFLEEV